MKKSLKKLISIFLAATLVISLTTAVFAATIPVLKISGYGVTVTVTATDKDNGQSGNSYRDYLIEIVWADGTTYTTKASEIVGRLVKSGGNNDRSDTYDITFDDDYTVQFTVVVLSQDGNNDQFSSFGKSSKITDGFTPEKELGDQDDGDQDDGDQDDGDQDDGDENDDDEINDDGNDIDDDDTGVDAEFIVNEDEAPTSAPEDNENNDDFYVAEDETPTDVPDTGDKAGMNIFFTVLAILSAAGLTVIGATALRGRGKKM